MPVGEMRIKFTPGELGYGFCLCSATHIAISLMPLADIWSYHTFTKVITNNILFVISVKALWMSTIN